MNVDTLRTELEAMACAMRAKAFGVADLDRLAEQYPDVLALVPGSYSRAVVAGVRLEKAVLEEIVDHPTPLYFHHYRQINYQLDRIGLALADMIQDAGCRALAIPASQITARNPMRGQVSHRLLGWAAGIGHLGRNGLLVHPEYGCQIRYVSVLTDAPLNADEPFEGNCGSCRDCIPVCPAGAIKEKREDFDLEACHDKLTEFRKLPFIGQHICGVCVKACSGKSRSG